jgi:nucleoside phosphorylase
MTQILAMPTLQKILDLNRDIKKCLMFGSAGSYTYNVGKLVILNDFSYKHGILNKYFKISTKLPKWIKKTNTLPKIEIFASVSVNDIEKPNNNKQQSKICFDMESSEMAYLLKINKIEAIFFRIITDFGEIDFDKIKEVYASKTDNLLEFINVFLETD